MWWQECNSQIEGINYEKTFASVTKHTSRVPKWGPHPTYFHEHLNIGAITQDLLWHPHLKRELLV